MGGIWGQTRSYGDTYHWAFHGGTVESVSAVPVFFFRRREPRAGDKVEGNIAQPGGAELCNQRVQAVRLCASGNFGSGYAGLGLSSACEPARFTVGAAGGPGVPPPRR